jgi:hypothetical protein
MTVATDSVGASREESEYSRLSSTDRESKSSDRESDSEPAWPPGGERDTRSLVVKVVSGDGLPESRERLSREEEAACGTAMTVAATGGRPAGAWLIECRWGAARVSGGVEGGQETEL